MVDHPHNCKYSVSFPDANGIQGLLYIKLSTSPSPDSLQQSGAYIMYKALSYALRAIIFKYAIISSEVNLKCLKDDSYPMVFTFFVFTTKSNCSQNYFLHVRHGGWGQFLKKLISGIQTVYFIHMTFICWFGKHLLFALGVEGKFTNFLYHTYFKNQLLINSLKCQTIVWRLHLKEINAAAFEWNTFKKEVYIKEAKD